MKITMIALLLLGFFAHSFLIMKTPYASCSIRRLVNSKTSLKSSLSDEGIPKWFEMLLKSQQDLLQEKEARLQEKEARLQEKEARLQDVVREKEARLQDAVRDKDALIREKDLRLCEKDEAMQNQTAFLKKELSQANAMVLKYQQTLSLRAAIERFELKYAKTFKSQKNRSRSDVWKHIFTSYSTFAEKIRGCVNSAADLDGLIGLIQNIYAKKSADIHNAEFSCVYIESSSYTAEEMCIIQGILEEFPISYALFDKKGKQTFSWNSE